MTSEQRSFLFDILSDVYHKGLFLGRASENPAEFALQTINEAIDSVDLLVLAYKEYPNRDK